MRALDRALMSGFYAIPLFNVAEQWIARWNRIERPAATALSGYLPETWWQKAGQPSSRSDAVIQTSRIADARRACFTACWRASRMRWRWSIRSTSRASPASRRGG